MLTAHTKPNKRNFVNCNAAQLWEWHFNAATYYKFLSDMNPSTNALHTSKGHQAILESTLEKHQLDIIDSYKVRYTLCALAITQTKDKVFVKVKGYNKSPLNEKKFQRAITSNKMAGKIKNDVMPRLIKIDSFERENILWLITVSTYGGKPISQGHFFDGDDSAIGNQLIERLRHSIEVIQRAPSASDFYTPHEIRWMIKAMFGRRVISATPELVSAHCDFHWGNILEGGSLVDWEMFARAPKDFDAASIVLFSANNPSLFERLCREFSYILNSDSGRAAIIFAAARILHVMSANDYSDWRVHEPNIREAVKLIVDSPRIQWPENLFN